MGWDFSQGTKGTTLTKAVAEEKIKSGRCRHVIKEIGSPSSKGYITKYVVELDVAPLITEIHIHADEGGTFLSCQNTIMTLPMARM